MHVLGGDAVSQWRSFDTILGVSASRHGLCGIRDHDGRACGGIVDDGCVAVGFSKEP